MKFKKISALNGEYMQKLGFQWHKDLDDSPYVSDELLEISSDEANAYYEAGNELYDMFVNAAQYIIDNNLFHEVGIPFNLVDLVKQSWENDVHWHLYGRFDLAGGIDGKDIKLIEFNADTPTALFETAIIQWAMLKFNNMSEDRQFNNLYDSLVDNFKRLVSLSEDVSKFEENYQGWKILFSSVAGNIEEENTTKLLQSIANDAGFITEFAYADEVVFDDENGIFYNDENFEYWFKLIPWEDIAVNEGELALILNNIMKNQKAIILNPAYTLLFQSKAILKILWKLYPNHPLLLEIDDKPLDKKCVQKPIFGREGQGVKILEKNTSTNDSEPCIYQEFYEFNKDENNKIYQAGLFFVYESCALGYRKGDDILNNTSKFVGHFIKDK